jgi:hypothetical protein
MKQEPASNTHWHNSIVTPEGQLKYLPGLAAAETNRRGVRDGHLHPKAAQKAHDLRKIHACWTCWIAKAPVSLSR